MVGQDYAWKLDRDSARRHVQSCGSGRNPDHVLRRQPRLHPDPFRPGQATSSRWVRGSTSSTRPSTCICGLDHIRELWAVRKPTKDGHVTSLEAYDAQRRDDHPVLRQAPRRRGASATTGASWPRTCRASRSRPRPEEQFRCVVSVTFSRVRSARVRCCCAVVWRRRLPLPTKGTDVFHGRVAHRLDRRLDHRDRLCARRGGQAGRPRFHQRLSRSGAQASRRRLHAGAVAGRRAVGQSDRHPGARGQRPEGSGRRAEEGERALHHGARDLRPRRHPRQDPRRRQGASARTTRRPRLPPLSMPTSTAAEKLTAGIPERKRVLFILSMQGGKILARAAAPRPTASSSSPAPSTRSRAFRATSSFPTRRILRQARRHPDDGSRRRPQHRRGRAVRASGASRRRRPARRRG